MKISVIGHFAYGKTFLDGQTVKTKIFTEELKNKLGEEQVLTFDTHGGWKSLIKAPLQVLSALRKSENILIFPAHNGLRVYAPLLSFFRFFFKKRKLHYVVIGGWLPDFLKKRKALSNTLKKFDAIYVETSTMCRALSAQGFANVSVIPNCKRLNVLSSDNLVYTLNAPYKLCTFSRVMKKKGMGDAIAAISRVNESIGQHFFSLDIYGPVDESEIDWFNSLSSSFPEYVKYCGPVPFDKSVEVLKDYFALLFPTRFYTEGVPGTIIDAYTAGIPVISARWESFADVVDDGVTGVSYEFENVDDLTARLFEIANDPSIINSKKPACIKKAAEFTPESALTELIKRL